MCICYPMVSLGQGSGCNLTGSFSQGLTRLRCWWDVLLSGPLPSSLGCWYNSAPSSCRTPFLAGHRWGPSMWWSPLKTWQLLSPPYYLHGDIHPSPSPFSTGLKPVTGTAWTQGAGVVWMCDSLEVILDWPITGGVGRSSSALAPLQGPDARGLKPKGFRLIWKVSD